MFTATLDRHIVQRSVCLFFSFLIVSAFLAIGAVGVESMVQNAQDSVLSARV
jgi:hypothetical protein